MKIFIGIEFQIRSDESFVEVRIESNVRIFQKATKKLRKEA